MIKNSNYKLRAFTHTVQMKSPEGSCVDFKDKHYFAGSSGNVKARADGMFVYPINPNKFTGYDIYNYDDMTAAVDGMRQDLVLSEWEYDRQDIAIDSELLYDELYKLNKMFTALFAIQQSCKNYIDISGGMELEKRDLRVRKWNIELSVYDKRLESKEKHPYTRCEFRFKQLNKDKQQEIFKKLYNMFDELPEYWNALNDKRTDTLYRIWKKEKQDGKVKNITEFYRKYEIEIFNTDIAKKLLEKITGSPDKYTNWMRDFRRKNKIDFISKTRLKSYISALKKAIKEYEHKG